MTKIKSSYLYNLSNLRVFFLCPFSSQISLLYYCFILCLFIEHCCYCNLSILLLGDNLINVKQLVRPVLSLLNIFCVTYFSGAYFVL